MENASTRSRSSSSLSLIASGIGDDVKQQDAAAAVVPPPRFPAKERNASDSAPGPRLASLTELLMMNQKAAPKGTSTPSSDSSPSTTTTRCLSTTLSSDQTPSPVRTSRSDDEDATEMHRRAGSGGGGGGGGAHRRPVTPAAVLLSSTDSSPSSVVVVDADLRRFVFHRSRAKRLVSGLRVHAFTRQAFVSSFTVGLALGSVIAIVLKILRDLAHRSLYG